jgi:hypothetical protein
MDYVVSRRQIKDLAFKYFDRIWGDVLPKVGKNYTYVFADSTGRGRIGFNKSIQYDRAYLILEDDVANFLNILPIEKKDFATLFTNWMNQKFGLGDVKRITAVPQERLAHMNLCVPPYCRK